MSKKEEYKELLNQCLEEECDCNHWCLLKEITIAGMKYDPRFLVQFKCVEIYKKELSDEAGKDVGWECAWTRWYESKLAEKFAEAYTSFPKLKPQLLYKKVIKL